MELKYKTSPGEFLGYFLKNPKRVKDYFKYSAVSGKSPFDLGIPWIAMDAIEFLDGFIKKGMEVFEYGAGGSTVYFHEKGCVVSSVENDQEWVNILNKKFEESPIKPAPSIIYGTYDRTKGEEDFKNSPYYNGIDTGAKFDIIIVDGLEIGEYKARPACFYKAEEYVKEGGIIVVDDSWRYDHLKKNNKAKNYQRFVSIGPGRKGMTSTDVYFY